MHHKHLCNHPPRTNTSNEHMFKKKKITRAFFCFAGLSVKLDAEQRSRESSLTPGSLQWFLPRHLQAIHLGGVHKTHMAFFWLFCIYIIFETTKHTNPKKQAKGAFRKLVEKLKIHLKNGGDVSWQWLGYTWKWECYECAIIGHSYKKWSYWYRPNLGCPMYPLIILDHCWPSVCNLIAETSTSRVNCYVSVSVCVDIYMDPQWYGS